MWREIVTITNPNFPSFRFWLLPLITNKHGNKSPDIAESLRFLMGMLNKYLPRHVEMKLILSGYKRLEFPKSLQKTHRITLLWHLTQGSVPCLRHQPARRAAHLEPADLLGRVRLRTWKSVHKHLKGLDGFWWMMQRSHITNLLFCFPLQ